MVVYGVEKRTAYVKNWYVLPPVAMVDSVVPDTMHVNFQDDNPIDRYSIANSFNGNLGSPIQSKLYFVRPQNSAFIFADSYMPYIQRPENFRYYNTKTPFSNLYATGGGSNYRAENQVNFLFTANANKRLNFGTSINFMHAVGEYSQQSAKRINANLFASYDGERYGAAGAIMYNRINNFESGGLLNPEDIHSNTYAQNMQVKLPNSIDAYSTYGYSALAYNHHYSLGFNKTIEVSEDSTRTEFVPVTRFTHTLKISQDDKRYYENQAATEYYLNTYYSANTTKDTAVLRTVSNTLAVSIEEEFNKWMKFGLTAYIANDLQYYYIMQDSASLKKVNRSRTKIGGILSKQQGARFRYNITAEFDVLGSQIGDLNVQGNVGGFFNLWKDSVALVAKGFIRNERPSFFQEQYKSNHFHWNNDFKQVIRTHVGGTFAIPTRSFELDISVENISNYIYFNSEGMPKQYNDNIQVIAANLKQNFRLWRLHLDNNVVYQISSDQDRLPLPDLTLYHNFYYLDKWFGVLGVQAGIDLRYHTAYYAPGYMPAIGQFTIQEGNEEDKVKIGNYPVMNAYVNIHIKQVRFFVKAYHVNNYFMDTDYFSMPGYPINPALFKVGVSWNFYN